MTKHTELLVQGDLSVGAKRAINDFSFIYCKATKNKLLNSGLATTFSQRTRKFWGI